MAPSLRKNKEKNLNKSVHKHKKRINSVKKHAHKKSKQNHKISKSKHNRYYGSGRGRSKYDDDEDEDEDDPHGDSNDPLVGGYDMHRNLLFMDGKIYKDEDDLNDPLVGGYDTQRNGLFMDGKIYEYEDDIDLTLFTEDQIRFFCDLSQPIESSLENYFKDDTTTQEEVQDVLQTLEKNVKDATEGKLNPEEKEKIEMDALESTIKSINKKSKPPFIPLASHNSRRNKQTAQTEPVEKAAKAATAKEAKEAQEARALLKQEEQSAKATAKATKEARALLKQEEKEEKEEKEATTKSKHTKKDKHKPAVSSAYVFSSASASSLASTDGLDEVKWDELGQLESASSSKYVLPEHCKVSDTRVTPFDPSILSDHDIISFIRELCENSVKATRLLKETHINPLLIRLLYDLPNSDLDLKKYSTPLNELREGVMDLVFKHIQGDSDATKKLKHCLPHQSEFSPVWSEFIKNVRQLIETLRESSGLIGQFVYVNRMGGRNNPYDFAATVGGNPVKLEFKYGTARCISELPQAMQWTTSSPSVRNMFRGLNLSDEERMRLDIPLYEEFYWDNPSCLDAYCETDDNLAGCKSLIDVDDSKEKVTTSKPTKAKAVALDATASIATTVASAAAASSTSLDKKRREKYLKLVRSYNNKNTPFFKKLRECSKINRPEKLIIVGNSYDLYFRLMCPLINPIEIAKVVRETQAEKLFIFCRNGKFFVEKFKREAILPIRKKNIREYYNSDS
jgi:chemotaxis protein histidine kinase CheA